MQWVACLLQNKKRNLPLCEFDSEYEAFKQSFRVEIMGTTANSESAVTTYQTALCQNQNDPSLNFHIGINLKSHKT